MTSSTPILLKLKLFIVFMIAYFGFYIFPNMWHPWQAHFLPLTWVDLSVPLIPWTFILYTSDYTLFLFVILLLQERKHFDSFVRLCFGTLITCGFFFLFFPTTYPRPVYPEVANAFVAFLMNLVRTGDTPNNCFPSMHVALTIGATASIRHRGKGFFLFFGTWTLLIILSTLTTKQHYLMDICGGATVASLLIYLDAKVFGRKSAGAVAP